MLKSLSNSNKRALSLSSSLRPFPSNLAEAPTRQELFVRPFILFIILTMKVVYCAKQFERLEGKTHSVLYVRGEFRSPSAQDLVQ